MPNAPKKSCSVEQVGKQRNGKPRYWCSVHQASATGRFGAKLDICEGAYRDVATRNPIEIDPADYPGGVALWGAVKPVYDTSGLPPETGIHVHARGAGRDDKQIDQTFDSVVVHQRRDLLDGDRILITSEVAVNYYLSRFANRELRFLRCPRCDEVHLDSGFFAVKPHRRHLCHGCGQYFNDDQKGVSNPIAGLRASPILPISDVAPVRPDRPLQISQTDYPGGIQTWACNPALIWTAERPEEEGLHVHAFGAPGQIAIDETFSSVCIDGVQLNEDHVKYFMAQQALPHMSGKVVALSCPKCKHPHFDVGDKAFFPHIRHECESCDAEFSSSGRRRLVVSNPFVTTRQELDSRRAKQAR
jgi:transposase-like protein